MGFGSVFASMQTVLRNNKLLLKKRKHFDKNSLTNSYGSGIKPEYDLPVASPQVLRKIRNKMQLERELFVRKALFLGGLFVAIAIALLIFLG